MERQMHMEAERRIAMTRYGFVASTRDRDDLTLVGGIGPKILPKLCEAGFMEAFWGKGRIGALMRSIPVRVITNDKTALLGAARVGLSGS